MPSEGPTLFDGDFSYPARIALVHIMRTGGTFINEYVHASLEHDYTIKNSWFEGLDRDWTFDEMRAFLTVPNPIYVHNHVRNWTEELVREFKEAGFFVISLVRPIGDQLCSLHCWLRQRYHPSDDVSLEQFIRKQLAKEHCMGMDYTHWQIPVYLPMFDYIDVMSSRAFRKLSETVLRVRWDPNSQESTPTNSSDNRGYRHYCQTGQISAETQRLVRDSEFHQRFITAQKRAISPTE